MTHSHTVADLASCKDCGTAKPLSAFEATPTGRRRVCNDCHKARRKASAAAARAKHDRAGAPAPGPCVECGKGPDEVQFKWRMDTVKGGWRSVCNTCINAEGYSQQFRQRQMELDVAAYRARNAATHLAWGRLNPDKLKEQQHKTMVLPDRKIGTVRTSAKQRGLGFEEEDKELMKAKLDAPCHYCAFKPEAGQPLNGLDRLDSVGAYSDMNTVTCCSTCNAMKGCSDKDVFVHNVRRIQQVHQRLCSADAPRQRQPAFSGRAELRTAQPKTKAMLLSMEDRMRLMCEACYLCGRGPSLGIDRVDASGDYTPDNSQPCCTDCNYMKKDLPLDVFLMHVAHIASHTSRWVLGDVLNANLHTCAGIVHPAATALNASGKEIMTFRSASQVERWRFRPEVGFDRWVDATPASYRSQNLSPEQCKAILLAPNW